MFAAIPLTVFGHLSAHELALYSALVSYADFDTGVCFPTHTALAQRAGMSKRSVYRVLASLRQKHLVSWVTKTTAHGSLNEYTVVLWEQVDSASLAPPPVPLSHHPDATEAAPLVPERHPNKNQKNENHERDPGTHPARGAGRDPEADEDTRTVVAMRSVGGIEDDGTAPASRARQGRTEGERAYGQLPVPARAFEQAPAEGTYAWVQHEWGRRAVGCGRTRWNRKALRAAFSRLRRTDGYTWAQVGELVVTFFVRHEIDIKNRREVDLAVMFVQRLNQGLEQHARVTPYVEPEPAPRAPTHTDRVQAAMIAEYHAQREAR